MVEEDDAKDEGKELKDGNAGVLTVAFETALSSLQNENKDPRENMCQQWIGSKP
jgi:bifunctional N-acetylglucosamine-1-phosphate-uridyltransferase/glucosamine-1-phosphate-acetyltransferase GlmU-like protein